MNELIEKVENLKNEISKTDSVKKIKELNKRVMEDKELTTLVEEYNKTQNEEIKNKILNNPLFQEYKETEIDINVMILAINKKLKEINDKGKCCV